MVYVRIENPENVIENKDIKDKETNYELLMLPKLKDNNLYQEIDEYIEKLLNVKDVEMLNYFEFHLKILGFFKDIYKINEEKISEKDRKDRKIFLEKIYLEILEIFHSKFVEDFNRKILGNPTEEKYETIIKRISDEMLLT